MIYRFGITTPANTPETAKQRTNLKITAGTIHQLDIVFPPGPQGLLHVQINRGLYQIWPSNSDESFAADNNMLSFRERQPVRSEPYKLEALTWNIDDTYDHGVIIRIGILKEFGLALYNKQKQLKMTEFFESWLLAYKSGKDWKKIARGNFFSINSERF